MVWKMGINLPISRIFTKLSGRFFLFCSSIIPKHLLSAPFVGNQLCGLLWSCRLAYIQDDLTFLRTLLRSNPCWIDGHLFLGFGELKRTSSDIGAEITLQARHRASFRSIQTIYSSGAAVLQLTARTSQEYYKGSFLVAMSFYLAGDMSSAWQHFIEIVETYNFKGTPFDLQLVEYVIATGMSLGYNQETHKILKLIPKSSWSPKLHVAERFLRDFGIERTS